MSADMFSSAEKMTVAEFTPSFGLILIQSGDSVNAQGDLFVVNSTFTSPPLEGNDKLF
jgi:hypothetical protein